MEPTERVNVCVNGEYFGVIADAHAVFLRALAMMAHELSQTDFEKCWLIVAERLVKDEIVTDHYASKNMAVHQAGRYAEHGIMAVVRQADGSSLKVLGAMIECWTHW